MVGNNTPVFFIRDPLKFGDFIHTQKRDPQTNLKSPTMMWDFWSLSPESLHQVTILLSDRGTPDGYRHMNGYSSHTFSLINSSNELFYVKWHFKTKQGIKNFTREQADEMRGKDPDYAQRDLFASIEGGNFPKWHVCVQIMPEKDADTYHINPFDLTKVWPQKDYPLLEVGDMVLDRNPENYFAEVEQAAFEPRNVVPDMGYSPDKMLQGRLISYPDAHRYRIGVNYDSLPVNKHSVRYAPTTATVPCASTATTVQRRIMSRIASTARPRIQLTGSDPGRSPARLTGTTIVWIRITTRNQEIFSG